MPERTITGLTQVVLKFAAGNDRTREQCSSTWLMRVTRGGEVFVLNREAGGQMAHISIHKDLRCHYKVSQGRGPLVKHSEWDVQRPIDGTGLRRLMTIVIPHKGLGVPANFLETDPETVLIPPPDEGQQIEVDILVEPGAVPADSWPGSESMGSALVGRVTLYQERPEDGLLNFTVVSTVREQGDTARLLSEARVDLPDGTPQPDSLRGLAFGTVEVDGQLLPVLTEMPVGQFRTDT
jgi:hypothetical protein